MPRSTLLFLTTLAVLVSVQAQNADPADENEKVLVQVYYESLCPDSKRFINTQLYPAVSSNNSLADYINLRLVPYGKSSYIYDKTTRVYNFSCHHGDIECTGNKYHACVLNNTLGTDTPMRYVQGSELDFVNCLMAMADKGRDAADVFPITQCALAASGVHVAHLENCARHHDGQQYLHSFGAETENLRPPLSNVPTITLNGVRNADAEKYFVREVCRELQVKNPKAAPPAVCATGGVGRLTATWGVVLVFIGLLAF